MRLILPLLLLRLLLLFPSSSLRPRILAKSPAHCRNGQPSKESLGEFLHQIGHWSVFKRTRGGYPANSNVCEKNDRLNRRNEEVERSQPSGDLDMLFGSNPRRASAK